MIRGQGPARSMARSPRVAVAAAVMVGVLGLFGVLAQASVIGSTPARNGAGVSSPATSGGGTSGGGTSGY
jgi:hypothetical protein